MKTIAITNHKGGVGKTTSVLNIGAALARYNFRTLLIDLDAQQNLTVSLTGSDEHRLTITDALSGNFSLPTINISDNLDLTPSDVELAIFGSQKTNTSLKQLLESVKSKYDFVLIDTAPSLGQLLYTALAAATEIFVPLEPSKLSLIGLKTLEGLLFQAGTRFGRTLSIGGIILTRFNRYSVCKAVQADLKEKYKDKLFSTVIRQSVALQESPLMLQSVFDYEPRSNGAKDYDALTREILARYKLRL